MGLVTKFKSDIKKNPKGDVFKFFDETNYTKVKEVYFSEIKKKN